MERSHFARLNAYPGKLGAAAELAALPGDLSWAAGLGLVVRREVFDALARLRVCLDVATRGRDGPSS